MKSEPNQIITKNKRAWFDFEILKQYTAGVQLLGSEIKSIRNTGILIDAGWVKIQDNEVFLIGANIAPYGTCTSYHAQANLTITHWGGHDPKRDRKLLLRRKEIKEIQIFLEHQKLTIMPLEVFLNEKNLVKLKIGVAKPKKKWDKRYELQKKDLKRDLERSGH